MDHSHAVCSFQSPADLLRDLHRFFRRKLLPFVDQSAQILAFDELHGDELETIGIAHVVDTDDVFVGHLVRKHQFLLEAIEYSEIPSQFRADHFQRDDAIHFTVPRKVNRTHPSLTKKLQDFISPPEYGARPQENLVARAGRVTYSPTGRGCSFCNRRSIRAEIHQSRSQSRRISAWCWGGARVRREF